MSKNENPLVVRKSNSFIQQYNIRLSAIELKVFNFMVAKIKSPAYSEEFNEVIFSIEEFYNAIGVNSLGGLQYAHVKNSIKSLADKSAWARFGDKETLVRLIEKPTINTKDGTITLKLDDDLKPFLLNMSGYAKMLFAYSGKMNSKYSIYLYELLKSWDGYDEKEFEIDYLREKLGAIQKCYENFAKFRQSILEKAVAEINDLTDLQVSYETKNKGRKITHVIFQINAKVKKIEPSAEQLPETEFESQINFFSPVPENKYSKENAFYAEAMSEAFTDEQVTELVKIAKTKIVENPLRELSYQEEMKIYHYIKHYYETLKMTDIKSTPYHTLRDKLLHDYEGVIE